MPPIRMLSTLAAMGAMRALALSCREAGLVVEADFAPTAALLARVRAGEAADVAILTAQGIEDLLAEGHVVPGSRVDVALSHVGLAVRAGAPKPDIATPAALRSTLLSARSIAYSRIGASGIFFAGLIVRLGIADAVNAKARIIPAGLTAELAASGEVELAVQQVSELLLVEGIDLVGKLPPELQVAAMFSGGILAHATQRHDARALLAFLTSKVALPVLLRTGLIPPNLNR